MGFQSSLNQTLGAVAGAAFAVSDAMAKNEAKKEKDLEAKVNLAKEGVSLKEEASKIESERNAILNSDEYKWLNMAAQKGSTEKDRAIASKELEKYKESLSILEWKREANKIQRADWGRRLGGIK